MATKRILSIETSCDETSLAILDYDDSLALLQQLQSAQVVSSIISSQASTFAAFGGVIPEVSARGHAESIFHLFQEICTESERKLQLDKQSILPTIDCIAVTTEPGLASALRVGREFAQVIAYQIEKNYNKNTPIIHCNHLRGHVMSSFYECFIQDEQTLFPHLHLLVSGGNTQLILMQNWKDWRIVGKTLDDAAGECLDKIGRMVGLSYPAGATIATIVGKLTTNPLRFSVGMRDHNDCNFSFSGLKTAVRYYIQDYASTIVEYEKMLKKDELADLLDQKKTKKSQTIQDILTSVHTVVIQQLIERFQKAIAIYYPKTIGISGGVSANRQLRERVTQLGLPVCIAPLALTGDNAIMIALAAIVDRQTSV